MLFDNIQKDRVMPTKPTKLKGLYIKQNIKDNKIVIHTQGKLFFSFSIIFVLLHDKIGPMPITIIAGISIGITVEL